MNVPKELRELKAEKLELAKTELTMDHHVSCYIEMANRIPAIADRMDEIEKEVKRYKRRTLKAADRASAAGRENVKHCRWSDADMCDRFIAMLRGEE